MKKLVILACTLIGITLMAGCSTTYNPPSNTATTTTVPAQITPSTTTTTYN